MTSRDDLRIGDAERDEVMNALREHFAQGRLTHDELDERLDAVLAARTAGDLGRVTADLPGPQARPVDHAWRPPGGWAPPPQADLATWGHHLAAARGERHRRRRGHHGRPHPVVLVLAVLAIASLVSGSLMPVFGALKLLFLGWVVFAVLGLVHHRHHHHRPRLGRRY
ncbi:DUF1707 SHOCT-like domain-containing protein [Sphaerisporangium fuscum]|uniref:DUF1707 SHOCT-like domain-containing protein n=1 Tax=Sphaerisporangium fuscum TaxID=2835868 RepID=UPI001BDC4EAE|nr:DUF1707 domain-containing protein [Sphaerisporangium fuscum]